MIEVFKTNVSNADQAGMLIAHIQKSFPCYKVNFDLEDCDRILRIENCNGSVESFLIITLLNDLGFNAEILPDELPAPGSKIVINQPSSASI